MKHEDVASALDRYDEKRDPGDHSINRVLPEDPGEVHAVVGGLPRTPTEPHFLDGWQRERAACGRTMKVLLPQKFNDSDPDACERCADLMSLRAREPDAWVAVERERLSIEQERSRVEEYRDQQQAREILDRRGYGN